jgi:hypothetical protein
MRNLAILLIALLSFNFIGNPRLNEHAKEIKKTQPEVYEMLILHYIESTLPNWKASSPGNSRVVLTEHEYINLQAEAMHYFAEDLSLINFDTFSDALRSNTITGSNCTDINVTIFNKDWMHAHVNWVDVKWQYIEAEMDAKIKEAEAKEDERKNNEIH